MNLSFRRGFPIFYTTKDRDEWESLMKKFYEQTNSFEPIDLKVGDEMYKNVILCQMKTEFSNGEYTIGLVVERYED